MKFPSSIPGVAALVLWGLRGVLLPASPTPTEKHDHSSFTRNWLFQLHIHFTLQNNMFPLPAQPLGLCSSRLPLVVIWVSLHREWVIEPPTCKPLCGSVPASFINHISPPPHPGKAASLQTTWVLLGDEPALSIWTSCISAGTTPLVISRRALPRSAASGHSELCAV